MLIDAWVRQPEPSMHSWTPSHLTATQREERRRAAAALFRRGQLTDAQIARALGVGRSAVCAWHRAYRGGGMAALRARPRSGRPSRLSSQQWRKLEKLLDRGARAAGFESERWTLRRMAELIGRHFHVHYPPRSLERPLKARGFSVQRPVSVARERDEYVIAHWPTRQWVALKKRPAASIARSFWWTRPGTPSAHAPPRAGRVGGILRC